MQKKVLLIGDSPISMSPYIVSYIEVFEKHNIPYELIFWNKTMEDVSQLPKEYIPYNYAHDNTISGWKKILKIYSFARFAKNHIRENDYAYIVVFTIAHTVYFHPFLERKYKGRYIFDIRDHSPLCKVAFIRRIIKKLVNDSAFTVLSSSGFLRWLPNIKNSKIVISHNTTFSIVESGIDFTSFLSNCYKDNHLLTILTIGQIAYKDSQKYFIEKLAGFDNIMLHYAGYGPAVPSLKEYVRNRAIPNVEFSGRYDKNDEPQIVEKADMINIWLKNDINADSCIANRFYLSALHRKPMIVNKGSHMASLCEKYCLGLVLKEGDDFKERITNWYENYDCKKFSDNCRKFLDVVKDDMNEFENRLLKLYC